MNFRAACLLLALVGATSNFGWGQGVWVPDTASTSSGLDPGMFAPGFPMNPSNYNAPGGDNFMWETPHTLLHLENELNSSGDILESWTIVGDVLWGSQTHSPFFFWGDNTGGVNEAMIYQEGLEWSPEADTLNMRSRGGCVCEDGFAIVGDVEVSDSTSGAFAMKLEFGGFMGDDGFGENGIDTLMFLGPDQSLEACASFESQLAMVGWGLDSCCAHKEVPILRVVDASDGSGWPGFGVAGTVALDLPSGSVNDSIGGLPMHESGGWFEDVAWTSDGQALFAAGAMLNGNAFQPLLAKFNLDGTLDSTFGEGGLSKPILSSVQNHWLVSLATLDDGRVVGLLKTGVGEELAANEMILLVWDPDGNGPVPSVFEWSDIFTPGHLDARGNDVAVVGTVGDVVSLFGGRQIGVASWGGEFSGWLAAGATNSPYLLTGYDVAWAGDSALHVSARVHSDSLATVPLPYALWADSSSYAIFRFAINSATTSIPSAPTPRCPSSGLLFPNPAQAMVRWELPLPIDHITITNSHGQVVQSINGPAKRFWILDTQQWDPGVYCLDGDKDGRIVARSKLVIVR